MKIHLQTHPLRYGGGNITEAFLQKKIGFEIEVKTDICVFRQIITKEQFDDLARQVTKAAKDFEDFHNKTFD